MPRFEGTVRCYDGFAWAVPEAFSSALAVCRFDEGDILYDQSIAYDRTWRETENHLVHSVQVKAAPRALVAEPDQQRRSVFSKNWTQRVDLEVTNLKSWRKRTLSSTQGRLYTMLWKGDLRVLANRSLHPPVPTLPMDLVRFKRLPATVPMFRARLARRFSQPIVFIMPYDETNKLLTEKDAAVQAALSGEFEVVRFLMPPSDAGLAGAVNCVPTVSILCFAVGCSSAATVQAALKRALYKPAKEKQTASDVFRISAHGHFQAL